MISDKGKSEKVRGISLYWLITLFLVITPTVLSIEDKYSSISIESISTIDNKYTSKSTDTGISLDLDLTSLDERYCLEGGNCSINTLNVTITNINITNTSELQVDSFQEQTILFVNNSLVSAEENLKWDYQNQKLNITGFLCLNNYCITDLFDNFWNIINSKYLINDSGVLDVNETQLNLTIQSNIINKSDVNHWHNNISYNNSFQAPTIKVCRNAIYNCLSGCDNLC